MEEKANPYDPPLRAVEAASGRWKKPVLTALFLLAAPLVLGSYATLGMSAAFVIAVALNFSIRSLKRSLSARGERVSALPYFVLAMGLFAAFLLWLRVSIR
jgi:hypothetical protein